MANSTTTIASGLLLADGTRLVQENVPIASTTTAGLVKPDGNTITVQADGTISSKSSGNQGSLAIKVSQPLSGSGTSAMPLTVLTGDGISIKSGKLCIDSSYQSLSNYYTKQQVNETFAKISDIPASYVLNPASKSKLGGVIIGSGLSVDSKGVISVSSTGGTNYVLPAATSYSLGGVKIGTGLSVTADGTISVNTASIDLNNYYTKEQADSKFALKGESTGGGESYTLPMASADVLGGIKIGPGLSIDATGTVTVSATGSSFIEEIKSSYTNSDFKVSVILSGSARPAFVITPDGRYYAVDATDYSATPDGSGGVESIVIRMNRFLLAENAANTTGWSVYRIGADD